MAVTNEKGALVGKIKSSGLNSFTSAVQLLSDVDRNNRVPKSPAKGQQRLRFN